MTDDERREYVVAETITCVDCLGIAHLLGRAHPEETLKPGDVVAYRCADCGDRWDLIVDECDT